MVSRAHKSAFTLIELLVVVAIISLLSSIVIANVQEAREKARDTRRIQDLRQIRTALEQYYIDHGHYPSEVGKNWANHICADDYGDHGTCSASPGCRFDASEVTLNGEDVKRRNVLGDCGGKIGCSQDNVGTIDGGCNSTTGETENILAEYMASVPQDPINDDEHFYYYDANHDCGGDELRAVLFISKLESRDGNIDDADCVSTDPGNDGFDGDNVFGEVTEDTYVIELDHHCYITDNYTCE